MKTGQWTYTLTPENDYWSEGEFFDTKEEAIKIATARAKEENISEIAIAEIKIEEIPIVVNTENIIDMIEEASVSSSNCTDWLEVGQFFEEFSDEEIEELEEMITNYLTKIFRHIKGNSFNLEKAKYLIELAKSSIYTGRV